MHKSERKVLEHQLISYLVAVKDVKAQEGIKAILNKYEPQFGDDNPMKDKLQKLKRKNADYIKFVELITEDIFEKDFEVRECIIFLRMLNELKEYLVSAQKNFFESCIENIRNATK